MIENIYFYRLTFLIAFFCLLSSCKTVVNNQDYPCDYKLVLSHNEKLTHYEGNGFPLYISLQSNEIEKLNNIIVQDLHGEYLGNYITSYMRDDELHDFHEEVIVKVGKSGKYTLGPYKLKIGNCELVSNTVEVIIHKRAEEPPTEFAFSESKIVLKVYQEKSIALKTNIEVELNKDLKNEGFDLISGSTSMNTNITYGKLLQTNKYTYTIIAKKPGKYKITKEYFKNLPPDLNFTDIEVEIK